MPHYPTLYQFNIRVYLNGLSQRLGRQATLDDLPAGLIADWAEKGFEWIWLLGVWQTGQAARTISRQDAALRGELQRTLPDLVDDDIAGSCFAVQDYSVSSDLGGNASLARLRERMKRDGLRLMLDFVPNHMAPDHRWLEEHPDYFVFGTEEELRTQPQNYRRVATATCERIIALGRDPHFSGWSDTLQLNYGNLALQHAMLEELQRIAQFCDGVRCDMAMLLLPTVFKRTWGIETQPFWPNAIRVVRDRHPSFLFMAEVYWDLEWELQQQGFDYCYDKRLYDRLRDGLAGQVRWHMIADLSFQSRLVRFLENHDEARAAEVFPIEKHRAAAVLTYLSPGLRFFHHGQLEGHRHRISPHAIRGPVEHPNGDIQTFYARLLNVLRHPSLKEGGWQLLDANGTMEGDRTHENIIAYQWTQASGSQLLVVVNYSAYPSRARIPIAHDRFLKLSMSRVELTEGLQQDRGTIEEQADGLRFDLLPWEICILTMETSQKTLAERRKPSGQDL